MKNHSDSSSLNAPLIIRIPQRSHPISLNFTEPMNKDHFLRLHRLQEISFNPGEGALVAVPIHQKQGMPLLYKYQSENLIDSNYNDSPRNTISSARRAYSSSRNQSYRLVSSSSNSCCSCCSKPKVKLSKDSLEREEMILRSLQGLNDPKGQPFFPRIFQDKTEAPQSFLTGSPIVMEKVMGVSLEDRLFAPDWQSTSFIERMTLIYNIALGIDALHTRHVHALHSRPVCVMHLDLKPANILIRDDSSIVIIDFGTSSVFMPHQFDRLHNRSISQCSAQAPLTAQNRNSFGKQYAGASDDVYSLATVMIDILCPTSQFIQKFAPVYRTYNDSRQRYLKRLKKTLLTESTYLKASEKQFIPDLIAYISTVMQYGEVLNQSSALANFKDSCRYWCCSAAKPAFVNKTGCPSIRAVITKLESIVSMKGYALFERKRGSSAFFTPRQTDPAHFAGKDEELYTTGQAKHEN